MLLILIAILLMSDATAALLIDKTPLILAGLVALVSALGALRNSKAALVKSVENGQKQDIANAKADILLDTTKTIHELTNSTLSDIKNQLAVAQTKILGLEALVRAQTIKQGIPGAQGATGEQGDKGDQGPKGGITLIGR